VAALVGKNDQRQAKRPVAHFLRAITVALLGPRRATALAERTLRLRRRPLPKFAALDEEVVIRELLAKLRPFEKYAVDIGASDGWSFSNTYSLFKDGWHGLAVEYDDGRFAQLTAAHSGFKTRLAHEKVTPLNVVELLKAQGVPSNFTFLSIDIDGYDYFVLAALLSDFRPKLVCAEINEKIPPPLKFTVKWDPDFAWVGDHFFGQSISKLGELADTYRYSLVALHYNNAFLVPAELDVSPSLTPADAYDRGYASKPDRREKFPWNADVDTALGMSPHDAEDFFRSFFAKYDGQYQLTL
jgi:hypothetical protein